MRVWPAVDDYGTTCPGLPAMIDVTQLNSLIAAGEALEPEELAKALRLVETRNGHLVPDLAGLLLLGREQVLREIVPTHEVFFQVLDGQGNVKVSEACHGPLIGVLEELENRLVVRNQEREVTVGLFRIPIPDYAPESG